MSYVDDTITIGQDLRQIDRRAHMLAYVCTKCGMWLNPDKCHTHVQAGDFLGHTVACVDGDIRIHAQRHKVAQFLAMPPPNNNKRQLLSAWLKNKYYSKADDRKAGATNKQLHVANDGPFLVTKVESDGIHFEIEKPEWMRKRTTPRFHIKAIRAIVDRHPDPSKALEEASERADIDDEDEEYEVDGAGRRCWIGMVSIWKPQPASPSVSPASALSCPVAAGGAVYPPS
eukprot:SAG31_NODE_3450_length_4256_cov_7.431080_3_plen_229_part_00